MVFFFGFFFGFFSVPGLDKILLRRRLLLLSSAVPGWGSPASATSTVIGVFVDLCVWGMWGGGLGSSCDVWFFRFHFSLPLSSSLTLFFFSVTTTSGGNGIWFDIEWSCSHVVEWSNGLVGESSCGGSWDICSSPACFFHLPFSLYLSFVSSFSSLILFTKQERINFENFGTCMRRSFAFLAFFAHRHRFACFARKRIWAVHFVYLHQCMCVPKEEGFYSNHSVNIEAIASSLCCWLVGMAHLSSTCIIVCA